MPMTPYAHAPWFHDTVTYSVTLDGGSLLLKPIA